MGQYYRRGNFVAFFRDFLKLPISERLAVAAGIDFADLRYRSLWIMKKAYGRSKIPLDKIVRWLVFRTLEDAKYCVEQCGFQVRILVGTGRDRASKAVSFQVADVGLVDFSASGSHEKPGTAIQWRRWPDDELEDFEF